jgi:hypothetical protein
MTPLDDELRRTLTGRADLLVPSPDPLAGIEARVSRIRRRRAALAVSGAVAAVAAVALAVPALVPDRNSAPQPGATPSAPAPAVLDPAHPWPLWGDETLLTPAARDALQRAWATSHPGSTVTPLLAQTYEPSGQAEVAVVATGGGELRTGWATLEGQPRIVLDDAAQPDAAYQFALDGDEGVTRLYVVAAPDSRVEYAADGVTYRDITQTFMTHADGPGGSSTTSRGGVGITAVETTVARVRVTAADGSVVYEADARGASAGAEPANVLTWQPRGLTTGGPSVPDLLAEFARRQGASVAGAGYRALYTADTDSGVQYTLGQVSYDDDGTGAFRPVADGRSDLNGIGLVDRAKDATDDRLELLDGDGNTDHPLYRGPVATFLELMH